MRYSNPFRYSFDAPYASIQCVYKFWFGTRYFIWKAKALHQSVNQISVELDRKLRLGVKPGDVFEPVIKYIRSGRIGLMRVELIKDTPDVADMLITEFLSLQVAKTDPKCLNKVFEPPVPQWVPVEDRQKLEVAIAEFKKKANQKVGTSKLKRAKKNLVPGVKIMKRSKFTKAVGKMVGKMLNKKSARIVKNKSNATSSKTKAAGNPKVRSSRRGNRK